MKYAVTVVAAWALCVTSVFAALELPSDRRIVIGTEMDYPPYSFLDENGRATGYNVDLTRAIAQVMQLDVEIRIGSWGEIRQALESGEIDAISGMFYSAERDKAVDFSPAYTFIHHAIFMRRDTPAIETEEYLRGKDIIVMRGDIMHDYVLEQGLSDNPALADTQADALRLLASGEHDCALVAHLPGLYWAKELGLSNIKTVGPLLRPSEYCYAVAEGNAALLHLLGEGLATLGESGAHRSIYDKWLGVLAPRGVSLSTVLKYIAFAVAPLLLILAFFAIWSRTLKRQVASRTRKLTESEERYRTVAEETPVLICRFVPGGEITYANEAYCKYFEKTFEELVGSSFLSLIPEADRETVMANISAITVDSPNQSHEHHVIAPDGGIRWQRWTNRALFDDKGEPVAYQSIGEDVTERKRAEEALRVSNRALTVLSECNQTLVRATDEGDLLHSVCRILVEMGGHRLAWAGFAERDEAKSVCPVAQMGYDEGYLDTLDITWADTERGRGPTGTAIRTGRPVVARHILTAPEFAPWRRAALEHGYASSIALPLMAGERAFGALNVYSSEPDAFSEQETGLLVELADDLAYGIIALRTREEHKRAEDRATRFNRVLEGSLNEIYIFDAETFHFIEVNRGARENLGYSIEELRDLTPLGLKPEFTAESFAELVEPLRTGEQELVQFTTVHRRKDGSLYPVDVYLQLMADGSPVFVAIILDITERKRAEKRIKRQQYYLEKAQELGRIGTWELDLRRNKLFWTDENCRIFGVPAGSVVDYKVFLGKVHPDDREYVDREWSAALDGKPYDIEHRIVVGGATKWVREKADVEFDEERAAVNAIGFTQDITDRKRAEAERERLVSAIEQAAEAIVITDAGATIQYVNPAFERITGYPREEAIGQNPRILQSGEQDEAFYKEMWDSLTRRDTWRGRFINKKKDGTLYTEEATISPVRDASGKAVNYVGVKRDITRESELEAQLRQAQKMEAVGQLAGGVAHDFNNILQGILGYAYLGCTHLSPDDKGYADFEAIRKAGERATTLIRQLLAFSRCQVMQAQNLDLNDAIADAMKMLRHLIPENIELDFAPGGKLAMVSADPGHLEQVLMNLATNSRDAMPGGGRITIETENVLIDDAYCEVHPWAKPGWYVRISFTDTGSGMDEDTQNHLFEPFFTTKEVGKGTGLGLAMIYGTVKQHDGMITVYSEMDKGTVFKIYMPVAALPESEQHDATAETPVEGGTETILVAEDDEVVADVARNFLENAGYTVLLAADGAQAVEMFKTHADEIDLVLLDVIMPKLGGRDAYEQMRATSPNVRVLFNSGYSESAIPSQFIMDENLDLIKKPYDPNSLLRKVREILGGGR